MSKILKILAGVIILLVIALGIFIATFDINRYKGDIIALVEEQTGRDFDIAGELRLRVSLIPTVIVEGVTFGNADWGSAPEMLKVKYFEAQVGLIPLLSGTVAVSRLILVSPEILLETNKQGQGNWVFATAKPETEKKTDAAGATPPQLNINEVSIKSAKVTYKDGVTGKTTTAIIDEFTTETGGFTQPMELLLRASYNEIPIKVDGTLGSLGDLTSNKSFPLDINASVSDAKLALKGKIDQPLEAKGVDAEVTLEINTLASFEKIAGTKFPKTGPIRAAGQVSEKDGTWFIKAMQAEVGKAKVGVDGKISNPEEIKGLDFVITFEAESLTYLNDLAGTELPAIGPLSLTTNLKDKDGAFQLSNLKLKAGNSDLAGTALINTGGKRPALNASLSSNLIDLVPFTATEEKKKVKKDKVFPAEPLPFESLKSADVKLDLKAKQIKTADLTLNNVNLALNLNNGKLSIAPLNAGVGGGTLAMQMNLDASSGKSGALDTSIDLKNFEPATLPALKDELSGGKTYATIKVRGSGSSVAAIMAGLNGNLLVKMGPGVIKSKSGNIAGSDLFASTFSLLYPGAKGSTNELECGVIKFDIKDGIATSDQGIAFATTKMNILGSGVVDLKTEKLDIGINPQARTGTGISAGQLAELVRIGGTLAEPKAVPDTKAAFKTAASVGAAVATGGLSILAQGLFDRASADSDPCATALGIKPAETPAATQTEQESKSVTEKATDTVKDAGSAIKDTFKGLFGK